MADNGVNGGFDLDALFVQGDVRSGDLDDILQRLQYIIDADVRKLYDPKTKTMLAPPQWPDEVVLAISRAVPTQLREGGVRWHIDFADRNKALDVKARLLGLYAKKEDKLNPIEVLLQYMPREDIIAMRQGLKGLIDAHTREQESEGADPASGA